MKSAAVLPDERKLFYDRFASQFDAKMNRYDLETRLQVIFDELLPRDLAGQQLLDDGCGTGWFSKLACERGAQVTSLDVGEQLLAEVAKKCKSERVVGDALQLVFPDRTFAVVVSSEMIEHTVDPRRALAEMFRVLKPGGTLALTCPNWTWKWGIHVASVLKLRPYAGYENFPGYAELGRWLGELGFRVERHYGFHPWPFQLRALHPLSRRVDRFGKLLGPLMINQAVLAHRPA